jgi:hypothetical protein
MNRCLNAHAYISILDILHRLEEFSKLRHAGRVNKGDEVTIIIKGPVIECRCSNGGVGVVNSEVLTRAVNDVYFGKDSVSPAAKTSVHEGIRRLLQ